MTFTLHTERITAGEPRRWAFVLHGIFGSAANWRLFMRNLAKARPDWGFVLVDQRGHHRSLGAPPPHTIDAMADDLLHVEASLGLTVEGVVGHSLGGKVALAYARHRAQLGVPPLSQLWVLDSQPGARGAPEPDSITLKVLEMLEGLPLHFERREAFVRAVREAGQSQMVAAWLAMNVRRTGDRYELALDLPALRQILWDFYEHDAWDVLETPGEGMHVVVGGKSYVWTEGDLERLRGATHLGVHVLPEASHWVHADEPEALLAVMRDAF